jgi:hypothetical protein
MEEKRPLDDEQKEQIAKMMQEIADKAKREREETPSPDKPRQIRIELGRRYSSSWPLHLVASFLVNFILIFAIVRIFRIADIRNDLIFLPLALLFTAFEESVKAYLFKRQARIVIYSSGLIFFFSYLIFFYVIDLQIFRYYFSFRDPLYPIAFIVLLQISRTIVKTTYITLAKRIQKWHDAQTKG